MNQEIEGFYRAHQLIRELKHRKRTGWDKRSLSADSIADHTYGSILLAWILSYSEGADHLRVLELAVVHELVMAKLDDATPSSNFYSVKNQIEEVAKLDVADALPSSVRDRYLELFDEYQGQKSREAQIARDAAKLETLLQGDAFETTTGYTDILDEFLGTYADIVTTPLGKLIFDHVRERHRRRKERTSPG